MADKEKLRDMLDAMIDQNAEQAQVNFHSYLEDKMREVLHPAPVVDTKTNKNTKK